MALQFVTLEAAAKAFRVHPRTIVRALSGDHNTYWTDDINHDRYSVEGIADAYGMKAGALRRVLEGRDALLKPKEAAEQLGVKPRTFREHLKSGRYQACRASHGRITRYLKSQMITHAFARAE